MKEKIKNIVCIILGNVLIAFALSTLLLENQIIAGGVSGIGIVLNHYFALPISLCVGVINIALFILGFLFLGKVFAMTTMLSTFIFPLLLEFFESQPMFHGYLNDPLLSSILAGCLIGLGVGMILKSNASTGGIDIIALIVNKKFNIPVHIVLNCMDLSILLFQFTYNDTTHVIYGILTVILTSFTLNKTLTMGRSLVQIVIISDHHEAIREMILHDNDAGVTLLASEKGYSKEKSKLLLSVVPYPKLPIIKDLINQIDPLAFIIVSHVEEVGGKGFTFDQRDLQFK